MQTILIWLSGVSFIALLAAVIYINYVIDPVNIEMMEDYEREAFK